MATGSILFLPESAVLPDGSTDNVAPSRVREKGSQSGRDVHFLVLEFDGAGSVPETAHWTFVLPPNYASGGSLKIQGMINSTTGNVARMQAQLGAITPADADTPLEHAFSTAATVDITANTTEANRLLTGTITLNMDSAAAGDLCQLTIFRDPANAGDTHATDFRFRNAVFEYTTT